MIRDTDPKLFTKWAHGDSQGYTQNNKGKISKVETKGETVKAVITHNHMLDTRCWSGNGKPVNNLQKH